MKWPVEVDFDPAWSAGDVLPMVLGAPALHKTESYRAHLGQFKHCLVAAGDGLRQQLGKVLIVEDTQTAAWRDLADGGRMKAVVLVAVSTLNENTRIAQALGEHLTANVVQM